MSQTKKQGNLTCTLQIKPLALNTWLFYSGTTLPLVVAVYLAGVPNLASASTKVSHVCTYVCISLPRKRGFHISPLTVLRVLRSLKLSSSNLTCSIVSFSFFLVPTGLSSLRLLLSSLPLTPSSSSSSSSSVIQLLPSRYAAYMYLRIFFFFLRMTREQEMKTCAWRELSATTYRKGKAGIAFAVFHADLYVIMMVPREDKARLYRERRVHTDH
ncbi:hypothetical protein BHM03_00010274 [Ensete ventricosum]|uniref:Uncharacterized protein n=1 Tax=Ensete ventricosum TaxID=4639 RepID=A0A445MCU4_ENSVE|nr:hypothetical protein BHM03_00010274 [Ensete ventricosum]